MFRWLYCGRLERMSVLRTVFDVQWSTLVLALILLGMVALACGSNSSEPDLQPAPSAELISTDLALGENRIAFGLIDPRLGAIKGAPVQVQAFFLADSPEPVAPQQPVEAVFQEWPGGFGGVYVARIGFDQPGEWGLAIYLMQPDGAIVPVTTTVRVARESRTPPIGSPAPSSVNKTAKDVVDLKDLTTDMEPDVELYAMTIAEALLTEAPLLVTFATPAYCTSATCGAQVDMVKKLKANYGDRMNFIHVEVYDNPSDIREGGFELGRISPTLAEWNLTTEPWTFVMDSQGLVHDKFEGFVGAVELEEAIAQVFR